MSEPSLEQQVKDLTQLVQKQSKLTAQTGKQLMELQVKDVKSKMAQIDNKQPKFDPEDFASNEDIAQLVFEILNQLEFLEDRSIKRVYNSHLLKDSLAGEKIAPLCNKDGEPAPANFPETLGDLEKLPPLDLIKLCEFYDLFVDHLSTEDEKLLNSENLSPEDAMKLANAAGGMPAEDRLATTTADDLKEIFDEFARYIGVRIRRGTGW